METPDREALAQTPFAHAMAPGTVQSLQWAAPPSGLEERGAVPASVVDLKLLLLIAADTYSNFKSKTTLESYIC